MKRIVPRIRDLKTIANTAIENILTDIEPGIKPYKQRLFEIFFKFNLFRVLLSKFLISFQFFTHFCYYLMPKSIGSRCRKISDQNEWKTHADIELNTKRRQHPNTIGQ